MSYKTILVHVDKSPRAPSRIALAARIASEQGAHLVGAAMTGIPRYIFYGSNVDITRSVLDAQLQALVDAAKEALDRFDTIAASFAGVSFERRVIDDDEGSGLASQSRYADLVVLSQSDPNVPLTRIGPDLPAFVMLHSGSPVLVVPYAGAPAAAGRHPLVAWDESMQASRTIARAVPLLRRAHKVSLVVFNAGAEQRLAGADIALYLARHGVNVEVLREETEYEIGFALLELAGKLGADMLVMGGYGHARFREVVLGGVTHTMLSNMTIPVVMSH
jgi:nucleotide-binding universal stress UspA family protein